MFLQKYKFSFITLIIIGLFAMFSLTQAVTTTQSEGMLIMKKGNPAVYYVGSDQKAYVFPDAATYKTWYSDFRNVKTVSSVSTGKGNITVRPGVKMVKFQNSNKVYAVSKGAVLHWIVSADVARSIYGNKWTNDIVNLPDKNVSSYTIGDNISDANKYDRSRETVLASSVNEELTKSGKIVEKIINTKPVDTHSFSLLTSLGENLKASLSPRFKSSITSYTLQAKYDENTLTLKPRVNRSDSKIYVNGILIENNTSLDFLLKQGKNHYEIKVRAATKEETTYILDVMRDAPNGNAYLKSFSHNLDADLDPVFSPSVYAYKIGASYIESTWTPKVKAEDTNAKITYKNKTVGTGYTDKNTFPLAYGKNEFEIRVLAQSGSVRTYTITVQRSRNPELGATYLKSLSTDIDYSTKGISPHFSENHTLYYAHTDENDESVLIKAQAKNSYARVFIDGINSTSRQVLLHQGRNEFNIVVEVEGGFKSTYKLTIDRGTYSN